MMRSHFYIGPDRRWILPNRRRFLLGLDGPGDRLGRRARISSSEPKRQRAVEVAPPTINRSHVETSLGDSRKLVMEIANPKQPPTKAGTPSRTSPTRWAVASGLLPRRRPR